MRGPREKVLAEPQVKPLEFLLALSERQWNLSIYESLSGDFCPQPKTRIPDVFWKLKGTISRDGFGF
jgi:hypothetical protein